MGVVGEDVESGMVFLADRLLGASLAENVWMHRHDNGPEFS